MAITIDEAMTDLSIQREVKRRLGKTHEADALGLGIEALKAVKKFQSMGSKINPLRLPGETEPKP